MRLVKGMEALGLWHRWGHDLRPTMIFRWPARMAPGWTSPNSARTRRARAAAPSTAKPRSRGRPSARRWRSSKCSDTSAASSSGRPSRPWPKKNAPKYLMAPGALLHLLRQSPGKLSPFQEMLSGGGGNRTRLHSECLSLPSSLRARNAQPTWVSCATAGACEATAASAARRVFASMAT
jgi:hypothetical protein